MMMKLNSRYWKLLCATCLLVLSVGDTCFAQKSSGPANNPYMGGLPWDAQRQYYEQLPDNRLASGEMQSPLDRLFKQAAAQSWFKMDYVQWSLDEPGRRYIGAPVPGVPEPDRGYTILDSSTGAPAVGSDDAELINYTPTLEKTNLSDRNGLRLTYGLDTNYGTLEGSVMWIFSNTSTFNPGPPFPYRSNQPMRDPFAGAIAIPFSVEGQPATRAVVFSGDTRIGYDTSIFGSEINFITEDHRPDNGFRFRWLYGVRYVHLKDRMNIRGTTDTDPVLDASFESETLNKIFGPQLGFKTELRDDYFTIGARSAFTFGFNRMDSTTKGNNPLAPFDDTNPLIVNTNDKTLVTPMISLQLYTEIRLFERCKLFGSYDILFMDNVSRAYETIVYDVSAQRPGFGASTDNSSMFNHGFSVGLLFDF